MEAVLGSITGILGAFGTRLFAWLDQREKFRHELELKRLDLSLMDKEHQYLTAAAELQSAEKMQSASYAHDSASLIRAFKPGKWAQVAYSVVDVIRKMVRPVLTLYIIICLSNLNTQLEALLKEAGVEALSVNLIVNLYEESLSTVSFMAHTAFTWWFGSRPARKK